MQPRTAWYFAGRLAPCHIPWRDVTRVEIDQARPYGMYVVTTTGSRVAISGLGPTLAFHERTMSKAREQVRELNTIRSEMLSLDGHA